MTNEKLDLFNALRTFSESMGEDEAVFCFTLSEGTSPQILHFGGNEDVLLTGLAGIQNPTDEVKAMQAIVCMMCTHIIDANPELRKSFIEGLAYLENVT